MTSAPPILTSINPAYLECTLHSAKYRCLLRLVSNRSVDGNDHAEMAMPDISSLSAIPIHAKRMTVCISSNSQNSGQTKTDDTNIMYLLPKLFNATHAHVMKGETDHDGNDEADDIDKNFIQINHPSHELVRITRDLEVPLKERLKDASDGVMHGGNGKNIEPTISSGIEEEFLLRSEAIVSELLSAVQQQLRKEQHSHRTGTSNGRHGKKRRPTEEATTSTIPTTSPPPLKYYSELVRQLHALQSMTNVTNISLHKDPAGTNNDTNNQNAPMDLTHLSVTCLDGNKRSHAWHAELYPSIVLSMDLPSEFVLDDKPRLEKWWEDKADSSNSQIGINNDGGGTLLVLPRIHQTFEQALQKYQPLFEELDDLDSHLWILEPSLPARRCSVQRRIALWEGGASMVIVLDPENARGIPVMVRFLGVTMATMTAALNAAGIASGGEAGGGVTSGGVVDWRTSFAEFVSVEDDGKLHVSMASQTKKNRSDNNQAAPSSTEPANSKRWSEERSVRGNLELWFGSRLPSPLSLSNEKSDFLVECGICYAHRLPTEDPSSEEGPLPEAKCCNPSCNRNYHETCLFEWLHSLPTARVSFDRIFGSCPYCCEAVSVKIMNGPNNP